VALAGAIASAGLGLATVLFKLPLRLSVVFGVFFLCFAIAKLALAAEAAQAPPPVAGEVGRAQAFGSPRLFRIWVAYKIIAALVALAAAIYLFTAGAVVVDGFVR
jgi:hypothetical protein